MPANATVGFDLTVNHEVVFECQTHHVRLHGEPKWFNNAVFAGSSVAQWLVDFAEMHCPVGLNVSECNEGAWVTRVVGLRVA